MADQIYPGDFVTFVRQGGIPVTIVRSGGAYVRVTTYGGKRIFVDREAE
jgi:hypothetical protein